MTVPIHGGEVQTAANRDSIDPPGRDTQGEKAPWTNSRTRPANGKTRNRGKGDRRGRSKAKRGRGQADGYLASANLAEEPGEQPEEKPNSQFASPFTASYLDYMDGNNRRGRYGGMNRLDYFIGGLVAGVILAIAAAFAIQLESTVMLALFTLASICARLWLASERCVNLGLDGLWCLALLVPCVGVLLGVVLVIGPEGYADHRKMDRTGYIIVVAYLFFLLAAAFFIAAVVLAGSMR